MQTSGTATASAPKQQRSRESVQRILDAASRLFAERRTTEVSIAEICALADVSRSSLYARYEDSDAIVHRVYEAFCGRALDVLHGMDRDFKRLREAGAGVEVLMKMRVSEFQAFYHAGIRLVQAMRYREA